MRFTWKVGVSICCAGLICGLTGWQRYRMWTSSQRLALAAAAYRLKAEQGDAGAEFELSKMYFYGTGVKQDYAVALRWARMAADHGFAMADSAIGSWYYHGLGVPQDYSEAFRWYTSAATKGDAQGEYGLGYMYRHGLGIQQDDRQAAIWIRKSADQGYPRAESEIGYLYQKGYGISQDDVQAVNWYRKAAVQGDAAAESSLAFMEFYGIGTPENRLDANQWFHKAAEQGDSYARKTLGIVWLGMTTTQLALTAVQVIGGLLLLIGSLTTQHHITRFQSKRALLAGCLCLLSAGIWWYSYNHYALRSFNGGLNAFSLFRVLFDFVMILLLVNVLRGAKKPDTPS